MFDKIQEALNTIVEFFSTVFDFVVDFVQDTLYVVKLTGEFVLKIPDYFSWLPAPVLALIVTAFSVVVIYKILGREG